MFDFGSKAELLEQTRLGGRLEGKAVDACTQFEKPGSQPGALETSMPGEPDLLIRKLAAKHGAYQTFQGARPSCQSLLSRVNS